MFFYGTLQEFGGVEPIETFAFAVLTKQIKDALSKLGMNLCPRTIEQAQLIANVRTQEGVYFREFQRPHGRHSGYKFPVTFESLLDETHGMEMDAVCSEAVARSSLLCAQQFSSRNHRESGRVDNVDDETERVQVFQDVCYCGQQTARCGPLRKSDMHCGP